MSQSDIKQDTPVTEELREHHSTTTDQIREIDNLIALEQAAIDDLVHMPFSVETQRERMGHYNIMNDLQTTRSNLERNHHLIRRQTRIEQRVAPEGVRFIHGTGTDEDYFRRKKRIKELENFLANHARTERFMGPLPAHERTGINSELLVLRALVDADAPVKEFEHDFVRTFHTYNKGKGIKPVGWGGGIYGGMDRGEPEPLGERIRRRLHLSSNRIVPEGVTSEADQRAHTESINRATRANYEANLEAIRPGAIAPTPGEIVDPSIAPTVRLHEARNRGRRVIEETKVGEPVWIYNPMFGK